MIIPLNPLGRCGGDWLDVYLFYFINLIRPHLSTSLSSHKITCEQCNWVWTMPANGPAHHRNDVLQNPYVLSRSLILAIVIERLQDGRVTE